MNSTFSGMVDCIACEVVKKYDLIEDHNPPYKIAYRFWETDLTYTPYNQTYLTTEKCLSFPIHTGIIQERIEL